MCTDKTGAEFKPSLSRVKLTLLIISDRSAVLGKETRKKKKKKNYHIMTLSSSVMVCSGDASSLCFLLLFLKITQMLKKEERKSTYTLRDDFGVKVVQMVN